jgi:hypothetical protein
MLISVLLIGMTKVGDERKVRETMGYGVIVLFTGLIILNIVYMVKDKLTRAFRKCKKTKKKKKVTPGEA